MKATVVVTACKDVVTEVVMLLAFVFQDVLDLLLPNLGQLPLVDLVVPIHTDHELLVPIYEHRINMDLVIYLFDLEFDSEV